MALLAPDPTRIGRPDGEAAPDRAPDWVAGGTPEPLKGDLVRLLGERKVFSRALDIVRYASDASPYRKLPKAVVMAEDANDVAAVSAYGRRSGTPVCLRSGGTSLNGQAQTDGILVDVRRHFAGIEVGRSECLRKSVHEKGFRRREHLPQLLQDLLGHPPAGVREIPQRRPSVLRPALLGDLNPERRHTS